jgi:hypothetical protein
MPAVTRPERILRAAWALPAALAAVVTGYLSWGAWVSAHDTRWLYLNQHWWRAWLRPDDDRALLILVALWLLALVFYWLPRRLQPRTVGLTIVVAMVAIGGVLGAASLAPCRAGQPPAAVAAWVLNLYVGQLEPLYGSKTACLIQYPLALQFARTICLGATLVGAAAVAAVLWREPIGRLRARMVRDATVLTGLDAMTLPLLRHLTPTGRERNIVVIEPDGNHPLLDEARGTGAHIMIADPTSARVLRPVLRGWRGCALSYLYALRQDAAENEAVLTAAENILDQYGPDANRQPHLVARIDDPRHAGHWRGEHSGGSSKWFEDALSPQESTACALVNQILGTSKRRILLCGDNTLALAVLLELAHRAWERRALVEAAADGRAADPEAAGPDIDDAIAPHPVERVTLLDPRAGDLQREFFATCPHSIAEALPAMDANEDAWIDRLLAKLDAMAPAEAADTIVVIADDLTDASMHEAGRAARLHPQTPVFVQSWDGAGITDGRTIFDRLRPFQRALLVDGKAPEDTWTRIARHWHECYRLRHPAAPGEARAQNRRPWGELDEFIRQDNILQLRSVMAEVVEHGRRWAPSRAVAPGSFIELSDRELREVTRAEHTRWYQRRRLAGWRAEGDAKAGDRALVNIDVVPWAELSDQGHRVRIDYVRMQLTQLEAVGFMPSLPSGGPMQAADFCRIGTVRAHQLSAAWPWTGRAGNQMCGDAGDWRVIDDHGDERTVRDLEFRATHEQLDADRWQRKGAVRAWRPRDAVTLRTTEGRVIAQPEDWIVESEHGARWPVKDEQFWRGHRPHGPPGT